MNSFSYCNNYLGNTCKCKLLIVYITILSSSMELLVIYDSIHNHKWSLNGLYNYHFYLFSIPVAKVNVVIWVVLVFYYNYW